jgi:hypothetical protein
MAPCVLCLSFRLFSAFLYPSVFLAMFHLSLSLSYHSSQAHSEGKMMQVQDHKVTGPHSRQVNQPAKKYHEEFDLSSISGRPGQEVRIRISFISVRTLKTLKHPWATIGQWNQINSIQV